MEPKSYWAFKIGLFLVVLSWFSFTIYQLGKSIFNGIIIPFTDVPGTIGFSFRLAAAFIALVTILFYLVKRGLSQPEVVTSMRWIVLLEAAYWVFFLPSAIWGFQFYNIRYPRELIIIETGLPCLIEAVVMPVVLGVLFLKLSSKKPAKGAIKLGLIAATANIFVFWLNYTVQWWADIILNGIGFISLYPMNAFSFALTTGGLLLLTLYTGVYAKKSFGTEALTGLNLKKAGAIVTALGLYFDVTLLLWLLFGSPSGWSIWHTFFVFHNMDLWMLLLPLVGLPLIFSEKRGA
jgi:hypothetical protein